MKLLDFGLVWQQSVGDSKVTQEGAILGTPAYMSPEQADATCDIDARSDIYSFGGLLYFLLTGKPPFPRLSAMKMILAHMNDPVVPPSSLVPDIPADVQAVVLRCLAKSPNERFQTSSELDTALAQCECFGSWTTANASAWWQYHKGPTTGDTHETDTVCERDIDRGATRDCG